MLRSNIVPVTSFCWAPVEREKDWFILLSCAIRNYTFNILFHKGSSCNNCWPIIIYLHALYNSFAYVHSKNTSSHFTQPRSRSQISQNNDKKSKQTASMCVFYVPHKGNPFTGLQGVLFHSWHQHVIIKSGCSLARFYGLFIRSSWYEMPNGLMTCSGEKG